MGKKSVNANKIKKAEKTNQQLSTEFSSETDLQSAKKAVQNAQARKIGANGQFSNKQK